MSAADTMPKLALTMLSFASPAIKFENELLGVLFASLIPTPGGKSTEEIVLMAVAELEAFIKAQFDDVAVRDAWHHVATTYDWFTRTYERAKNDPDAINKRSSDVLQQINEALGPNSFLELGIETVSD